MPLRMRFSYDKSRIKEVKITVEGVSGPACLLNTRKLMEINQGAVEHTDEYYERDREDGEREEETISS